LVAIPVAAAVAGCGAASASDPSGSGQSGKTGTTQGSASGHGAANKPAGGHGAVTRLTVGRATSAPPVAPGFVGISTVFSEVQQAVGYDPSNINTVLVQLLKNLAPGQRPVIRIGGDSTDWTWWPVAHMAKPGGIRFTLTKSWMAVTKALAQAANARLILGVNFEANSRELAAVEANALIKGIGSHSIAALELGNEPELYSVFGWYHTKSGAKVLGRPRQSWNQAAYYHDYASVAGALPRLPLAGPSVGGPLWIASLPQFLRQQPRVRLATIHAYPLKVCSATSHVTIPELLATSSSAGLAAQLAPAVRAAHHHHVPVRLDEMNAVSCGGQKGVSDTFATALWSVDFLFQLAKIGVSGVNINSVPSSINSPFAFTTAGNHWSAAVHPLYYGMQAFADAAPAGAHLLSVSGRPDSTLRPWATKAPDGTIHVVVINDALATPRTVSLLVPAGGGRPATVSMLRAAHVNSTSGVTLGGQSYGASTTTGTLAGTSGAAQTTPSHDRYTVRVPPATVAMLTIAPH
jgi:hypothetical protein